MSGIEGMELGPTPHTRGGICGAAVSTFSEFPSMTMMLVNESNQSTRRSVTAFVGVTGAKLRCVRLRPALDEKAVEPLFGSSSCSLIGRSSKT